MAGMSDAAIAAPMSSTAAPITGTAPGAETCLRRGLQLAQPLRHDVSPALWGQAIGHPSQPKSRAKGDREPRVRDQIVHRLFTEVYELLLKTHQEMVSL